MGRVMKDAIQSGVPVDNIWIIPYTHWVDTRLPPIWAGVPGRDIAIYRDQLPNTLNIAGPKLFMIARDDVETLAVLQSLYPLGQMRPYESALSQHDFWIFNIP